MRPRRSVTNRRTRCWTSSVIPVVFILLLWSSILLLLTPLEANAAGLSPPIQYNTVMTRYCKSSVDGAVLPVSEYVPQKSGKLPVWVDLHAFGGQGGISDKTVACARANGCIVIAPWGRNYHGFYADGKELGAPEPCIMDDFTGDNAGGWSQVVGNQWLATGETYQQQDWSDSWKVASRAGTSGTNCTASVDIKTLESSDSDGSTECAEGLLVRRQANGDCYLVDLDRDNANKKWVRVFKYAGGQFTLLNAAALPDASDILQTHNLKVVTYEDTIEVHVDYFLAATAQDASFTSGGVGLASFGARQQFDNFRVQDEVLYGERDVLDCVDQCLEELSPGQGAGPVTADCSKVFISGQSMGGYGAWNLGLHFPDRFAFIHPAYGSTDIIQGYNWIKAQYPDQDPSQQVNGQYFAREQDSNICEAIRAMSDGMEPGATDPRLTSNLHEYSARYLLENALNTPVRIEHAEYDTLVPNTTNPVTIKWLTTAGNWIKVKDGAQRPASSYANSEGIWQTWAATPGLGKCVPETSMYDPATGNPGSLVPTLGIWNNTDYSAMAGYNYGAHVAVDSDAALADPIFQSFQRLNNSYGQQHKDPDDIAYKTYDNVHTRAWWLTVEPAYPDQDQPGLARVHRDKAGNNASVHVKNVKTTTLDLMRMGLATTSGQLKVTVDGNTAPESEFKIQDTYRRTDLKLAGEWYPARKGDYQVKLDGNAVAFDMTGTVITIPNIDTTAGRTVTISMPAGLASLNLLAGTNPGFESGTAGWTPAMDGGLNGVFEVSQEPGFSHTGANSIRIRDPRATAAPYLGYWYSNSVAVQGGKSYTLSAFAKTRSLNSVARSFENGKYSPASASNAGIGILWLKANGDFAGWTNSQGTRDTGDWAPLEVTASAPAEATQARAALFTVCPNAQGITGSAWFDDVVLRGESAFAVTSISPASGVNNATSAVQIAGSGFVTGASVRLEKSGAVLNATGVVVGSAGQINCSFNLNGQTAGAYDVVVRNPDGQEARLAAGFTVTDACGQGAGASIALFAGLVGLLSLAGLGVRRKRKSEAR